MAIRTILALLHGERGDSAILDGAWALAERHQAHLACLRFGPAVPTTPESSVLLPPESASRSAQEHFTGWCAGNDPHLAAEPGGAPRASLDPHFAVESAPDEVAARMRLADLIVMARPQGWLDDAHAGLHAVLFEAGRPVLLLPPGHRASPAHKIVIAWNGSEQAARAVAFALPLLAASGAVHLFDRAEREAIHAGRGPAELVEHLGRHGIAAEPVTAYDASASVGADLLRCCERLAADLLVMGSYSKSPLREFLLGGVTRHILADATLPVMMVH